MGPLRQLLPPAYAPSRATPARIANACWEPRAAGYYLSHEHLITWFISGPCSVPVIAPSACPLPALGPEPPASRPIWSTASPACPPCLSLFPLGPRLQSALFCPAVPSCLAIRPSVVRTPALLCPPRSDPRLYPVTPSTAYPPLCGAFRSVCDSMPGSRVRVCPSLPVQSSTSSTANSLVATTGLRCLLARVALHVLVGCLHLGGAPCLWILPSDSSTSITASTRATCQTALSRLALYLVVRHCLVSLGGGPHPAPLPQFASSSDDSSTAELSERGSWLFGLACLACPAGAARPAFPAPLAQFGATFSAWLSCRQQKIG